MTRTETSTERRQNHSRLLALLALLGVCTAVAGTVAHLRGRAVREAIAVLDEIHDRGLAAYWPQAAPRQRWFLIRRQGQIVGWEAEHRLRRMDGFAGRTVREVYDEQHSTRLSTQWTLGPNARSGAYRSERVVMVQTGNVRSLETIRAVIQLQHRVVRVDQNLNGRRYASSDAAPENYLPEGLSDLIFAQVAQRRNAVQFQTVLDNVPPRQKRPQWFGVNLRYVEPTETPAGGAVVEVSFSVGDKTSRHRVTLDAEGNVVGRVSGELEYSAASREEVSQTYPHAAGALPKIEEVRL